MPVLPKFDFNIASGSTFLYQLIEHIVNMVAAGIRNSGNIILIRAGGIKPPYFDPKSNVLSLDYALYKVCGW